MRVNAVNAVETLLVTDELFRCVKGNLDNEAGTHVHTHTHPQYTVQYFCLCVVHRLQDIRKRQQYVDLMESVRNNAGDVR